MCPYAAGAGLSQGDLAAHQQPAFINHHGRANRAFFDAHIESEDMNKLFTASDEQLRRWNVDHQAHRDDYPR
jgi:hypothetical protein